MDRVHNVYFRLRINSVKITFNTHSTNFRLVPNWRLFHKSAIKVPFWEQIQKVLKKKKRQKKKNKKQNEIKDGKANCFW